MSAIGDDEEVNDDYDDYDDDYCDWFIFFLTNFT